MGLSLVDLTTHVLIFWNIVLCASVCGARPEDSPRSSSKSPSSTSSPSSPSSPSLPLSSPSSPSPTSSPSSTSPSLPLLSPSSPSATSSPSSTSSPPLLSYSSPSSPSPSLSYSSPSSPSPSPSLSYSTPSSPSSSSSPCGLRFIDSKIQYEYYQRGDIILGGLFSVMWINHRKPTFTSREERISRHLPLLRSYAAILAFLFAVDQINEDPDLLPNITLGYHLFDAYGDEMKSAQSVLQILSGRRTEVPNYSCMEHGEVAAFVGYSFDMEQILQLYGYTKINYGVGDGSFSNKDPGKSIFTMTPDIRLFYLAIAHCLKHFRWNWVGIITTDDGSAEAEVLELSREMTQHGICIEFIVKVPNHWNMKKTLESLLVIEKHKAQVVIVHGSFSRLYPVFLDYPFIKQKTLILGDSWIIHNLLGVYYMEIVNCSLSFSPYSEPLPELWDFIHSVRRSDYRMDNLLNEISHFYCISSNQTYNLIRYQLLKMRLKHCSNRYFVTESIHPRDATVFYVYTGVYVLATVLHQMRLFQGQFNGGRSSFEYAEKLKNFISRAHYQDESGKVKFFDDKRRFTRPPMLLLDNVVFHVNDHNYTYKSTHNSYFYPNDLLPQDRWLHINDTRVMWKTGLKPESRCNDPCSPGYRKAPNGGHQVCCYDCVPCSEGEFSNGTDSEMCYTCPENQWPDAGKTRCVPKLYEFLSYEEDPLAAFFSVTVIICCAITCYIIRKFIVHWDTPLVKANNRMVSFILLVSIFFSFICVFFFIGHPVDITCLLRQTLFGFFFSVAVSSVLAKTITVCIAFKATKPGSSWRKLVEVRLSYYVVALGSSIQVLICVIWLSMFPPYQEFDHHSYPGRIIIQCNEGSDICFYSMLGYLGLLAAVSFVLAFMVRTLPETFNEAKYITFSMLVFCSVWIAMIPAYLSTRGKKMTAVEIFAILTSSAGILVCIFFPKCYILIIKPELKSRKLFVET